MQIAIPHQDHLLTGEQVCIVHYGPFRGLRGTIRQVDDLGHPEVIDRPDYFYLIDLEKASMQEPVWFLQDEVEPCSAHVLRP